MHRLRELDIISHRTEPDPKPEALKSKSCGRVYWMEDKVYHSSIYYQADHANPK